jgi:hypothetical protein
MTKRSSYCKTCGYPGMWNSEKYRGKTPLEPFRIPTKIYSFGDPDFHEKQAFSDSK